LSLPVVCFYGVGGTGKTWLAKRLREAARDIVPTARLDFDPEAGGARLHDASHALAEIRLQYRSIPCPRFDLAYAWVRFKEGGGGEPQFHGEGAFAHAWELVAEVAEAAATDAALLPGANVVKWFMQKLSLPARQRFRQSRLADWLDSQLGSSDWQKLRGADRDDVFRELPLRLVRDLNDGLPQRPTMACRAVVFLDSFETVEQGLAAEQQIHNRQAAFRALYHPESPLQLVICGRDRLRWADADVRFADSRHLEQHLIGGLSEADASRFLTNCGIVESSLQAAVLRVSVDVETAGGRVGTHDKTQGYHPFSLGLCADTIAAAAQSHTPVDPVSLDMAPGDTQALAQRFLRSLADDTTEVFVNRLAWTPRFDEDAARAAFGGSRIDSQQDSAWKHVQALSFVQRDDRPGWYRLHSRMRFALSRIEANRQGSHQRHDFWRDHWATRSRAATDECAALAWYHEWHVAPGEALEKWRMLVERARQSGRMAEHFSLLGWWSETDLLKRPPTPSDVPTLNSLALETTRSTLGDPTVRLKQAIALSETALRICSPDSHPGEWAEAQYILGTAYGDLHSGDRSENLNTAIRHLHAALHVATEQAFPRSWAAAQHVLGKAHAELPTGDLASNLKTAIACYQAALRVRTEQAFPWEWARTQINLGGAYHRLPTGDRLENLENAIACFQAALRVCTETTNAREWALLQMNLGASIDAVTGGDERAKFERAIEHYNAALRVLTEDDFPQDWAHLQRLLAGIYERSPHGNPAENATLAHNHLTAALRVYTEESHPLEWAGIRYRLGQPQQGDEAKHLDEAIAHSEAALRVFNLEEYPQEYSGVQNNLGYAYQQLPTGDRSANLLRAIDCYGAALRGLSEKLQPESWVRVQENLGAANEAVWHYLAGAEREEHLNQAIACYQAVLRVYAEEHHPMSWARVNCNLGVIHQRLLSGDRAAHIENAIRCYQTTLRVYTEDAHPQDWARIQSNLAAAYQVLPAAGDDENLKTAIECCHNALRILTEGKDDLNWAGVQFQLGRCYLQLQDGAREDHLSKAIACFEAALRILTEERLPVDWAATQHNLGTAHQLLPTGDRGANLRKAVECFQAALRVYTEQAHPAEWALTQQKIEAVSQRGVVET
jgi:tetratricopeptide (TPR) repeat protein